jgi:hypothetical protein
MNADSIAVVQQGRIVEQGELIDRMIADMING